MMLMCAVYHIRTSRRKAEHAAHHLHTHSVLARHRAGHHVSDLEHAEMLARHGMHETDEDLRMHALEFFERDNNKDGAVSWLEYLEGFHNERLMVELFHHY